MNNAMLLQDAMGLVDNRYITSTRITTASIIYFARSVNIHPGIVVGRLINDEIIKPSYYHDLREKYQVCS